MGKIWKIRRLQDQESDKYNWPYIGMDGMLMEKGGTYFLVNSTVGEIGLRELDILEPAKYVWEKEF